MQISKPIRGGWRQARKRVRAIKELLKRQDGRCWFCHEELRIEETTIEHLDPDITDMYALAVAHEECNAYAGDLPFVRKAEIREMLVGVGRRGWEFVEDRYKRAGQAVRTKKDQL